MNYGAVTSRNEISAGKGLDKFVTLLLVRVNLLMNAKFFNVSTGSNDVSRQSHNVKTRIDSELWWKLKKNIMSGNCQRWRNRLGGGSNYYPDIQSPWRPPEHRRWWPTSVREQFAFISSDLSSKERESQGVCSLPKIIGNWWLIIDRKSVLYKNDVITLNRNSKMIQRFPCFKNYFKNAAVEH